jgi:hypothetical protein
MKEVYVDITEWEIDPVEYEAELVAIQEAETEVEYQLAMGE